MELGGFKTNSFLVSQAVEDLGLRACSTTSNYSAGKILG